jgi:multiple sugar transport system ATP-binding protein
LQANGGSTKLALGGGAEVFDFPQDLPQRIAGASYSEPDVTIGIRPEGVLLERQPTPGYRPVEAHIIEPLGAYDIIDLKVGDQLLRARTASGFVDRPGDRVWAKLDAAQTHFFSSRTGESLEIRLGAEAG